MSSKKERKADVLRVQKRCRRLKRLKLCIGCGKRPARKGKFHCQHCAFSSAKNVCEIGRLSLNGNLVDSKRVILRYKMTARQRSLYRREIRLKQLGVISPVSDLCDWIQCDDPFNVC